MRLTTILALLLWAPAITLFVGGVIFGYTVGRGVRPLRAQAASASATLQAMRAAAAAASKASKQKAWN